MRSIIISLLLVCSLPAVAQTNDPINPVGPRHSLMGGIVPAGLGLQYQYRLMDAPGVQLWLGGSIGTTEYTMLSFANNHPNDFGFGLSVSPSLLLGKKRGKLEFSMSATLIGATFTPLGSFPEEPVERSLMFTSTADLFYIGYRLQPMERHGFTLMTGIGLTAFGQTNSLPLFPTIRLGLGYSF